MKKIFIAMAALSLSLTAAHAEEVNIGFTAKSVDLFTAPWVIGKENGYFEKNDITPNFIFTGLNSSGKTLKLLKNGELDVAVVNFSAVVSSNSKTENPNVVAVSATETMTNDVLFTRFASPYKTIAQLNGKTLGIGAGSTTQKIVDALDPTVSLNWNYYKPATTRMVALVHGEVEATPGPFHIALGKDIKQFNWIKFADINPNLIGRTIVVRKDYLENNKGLVLRIVSSYLASAWYAYSGPEDSVVKRVLLDNISQSFDNEMQYYKYIKANFVLPEGSTIVGIAKMPSERVQANIDLLVDNLGYPNKHSVNGYYVNLFNH